MRHPVIAILLCVLATLATAQTPAPTPRAAASKHTASSASARPTPEIIKTAGAATHDQVEAAQAPARQPAGTDGEGRSHSGKAMLLAALAVMAGIALRRLSRQQ